MQPTEPSGVWGLLPMSVLAPTVAWRCPSESLELGSTGQRQPTPLLHLSFVAALATVPVSASPHLLLPALLAVP